MHQRFTVPAAFIEKCSEAETAGRVPAMRTQVRREKIDRFFEFAFAPCGLRQLYGGLRHAATVMPHLLTDLP